MKPGEYYIKACMYDNVSNSAKFTVKPLPENDVECLNEILKLKNWDYLYEDRLTSFSYLAENCKRELLDFRKSIESISLKYKNSVFSAYLDFALLQTAYYLNGKLTKVQLDILKQLAKDKNFAFKNRAADLLDQALGKKKKVTEGTCNNDNTIIEPPPPFDSE